MTTKNMEVTYLEFYSGIGGWSYALEEAERNIHDKLRVENTGEKQSGYDDERPYMKFRRLAAFDHSDAANMVLSHNDRLNSRLCGVEGRNGSARKDKSITKKLRPTNLRKEKRKRERQKGVPASDDDEGFRINSFEIERLSQKQLSSEKYHADIWCASPPCQPHTRNNEAQTDDADPRSKSFLHLCRLLCEIDESFRPKVILIENVVGFELSNCCKVFRVVLAHCGYRAFHFHLNPTQVHIPNDRPRYYCVAVLEKIAESRSSFTAASSLSFDQPSKILTIPNLKETIFAWVEGNTSISNVIKMQIPPCHAMKDIPMQHSEYPLPTIPSLNVYFSKCGLRWNESEAAVAKSLLRVPTKLLRSNASWCFDIVNIEDTRSSCFTHGYGKFIRGTGSILYDAKVNNEIKEKIQLVHPSKREFNADWKHGLDFEQNLRYFSGLEIACLMGFPLQNNQGRKTFEFPTFVSNKKQWQLLGNSLNVRVASKLCELGLSFVFGNIASADHQSV